MIQLILGGARSGKSAMAEDLALKLKEPCSYIATAERRPSDQEMQKRIDRHRQERESYGWQTLEEPVDLAGAIQQVWADRRVALVDCTTLWLSNCLLSDEDWPARKSELMALLQNPEGEVIIVGNEVGLGIVPMGEISRQFVDESGWLHQDLARLADRVILMTAGLPQVLKGEMLT